MLHPQARALLRLIEEKGVPPTHTLEVAQARAVYRDRRTFTQPEPPPVASVRDLEARGPAGPIPLRSYRPAGSQADAALPVLVYYHGGGWVIGDLDTHDVICRTLCNAARCAVFSVEYRKAPEAPFPAAVDDCFASLNFISKNSNSLKINSAQIAVGGDSAGGNLATVIALMARDAGGPAISFQVLIYPGTDQRMDHPSIDRNGEGYLLTKKSMSYFRGHYLPNQKDWLDWRASPLLAKSLKGLPPAYVLTAGFDPLVDEGKAYADRMRQEGVAVEYRNHPDMVHGFITMGRVLDAANSALADCAAALKGAWKT
jgi:acetyl esterase